MLFIPSMDNKKANDKLVYFTACVVIVYYPKLNEQRHYLQHEREVLSIAVGEGSSIVASSERADDPAIHIWDSN